MPQQTQPQAPDSAAKLANYARYLHPELKDEPDHMLIKYLFYEQPELKQDTKLQSAQEASRMAFEAAQPPEARTFAGGSLKPGELPGAASGFLRDYFLRGIEGLGIDPSHPVKSAASLVPNTLNAAFG